MLVGGGWVGVMGWMGDGGWRWGDGMGVRDGGERWRWHVIVKGGAG